MKIDWKYFFGFDKNKAITFTILSLLSLWFSKTLCTNFFIGLDINCFLIISIILILIEYIILSIIFYFNKYKNYLMLTASLVIIIILIIIILKSLGMI